MTPEDRERRRGSCTNETGFHDRLHRNASQDRRIAGFAVVIATLIAACATSPRGSTEASPRVSSEVAAREPAEAPASDPAEAPARDSAAPRLDAPIMCSMCEEWNKPREPFKIFGNTYYVGVVGLSSVLIVSSDGLVLLDGGLPQSAPLIDANIRKLGFRTEDVRLIVNSHEHFDHAGGIAALQQLSGARVAASAPGAWALMHGEPTKDDPQYQSGHEPQYRFPPVSDVEVVEHGQKLTVGDVTLTAHLTPGHTPGSTTWTWRSCESTHCVDVVYADSLNPMSDDGFRFTADASLVPAFEKSIATIDRLPCDVFISVHPDFSGFDEKLAARAAKVKPDPFIDENACHAYAASASRKLTKRIAAEAE